MKKVFFIGISFVIAVAFGSCRDASFNTPESSPWFNTGASFLMLGNIFSDMGQPYSHQLDSAKVFIAWEIPDTSQHGKACYIYNVRDTIKTPKNFFQNYTFLITLGDSLPVSVVRIGTKDTIAVGHIFLSDKPVFKNGDIISYDSLQHQSFLNQHIIGSMEDEAIVFRGGKPTIRMKGGMTDTLDDRICGPGSAEQYTILRGEKDPGEKYLHDIRPDFGPHDIKIENDPHDRGFHTAFWLE